MPTFHKLRMERVAIRCSTHYRTVLRTNLSILADPLKPHLIRIAVIKQVHHCVYQRTKTDLSTRDKDRHRLELLQLRPVLADRSINNIPLVFQLLQLIVCIIQTILVVVPSGM